MGAPKLLVETFREAGKESLEMLASTLEGDGFDAATLRLLAAWQTTPHEWKQPKAPCPDGGNPTPAAWAWLWSGIELDAVALADAANVSQSTARTRMRMLIATRLVFPDGTISDHAKRAMRAAVASRLPKPKQKEKGEKEKDEKRSGIPREKVN